MLRTLENYPLVSIGVPVRNGGSLIEGAIEELVGQSYQNIEIIISDNNSSDETGKICKAFAEKDARIKYIRQQKDLSALDNFKFVFSNANGEYFMWAAYDDRRMPNYVEVLLKSLLLRSDAVIAYPDNYDFSSYEPFNPNKVSLNVASNIDTPYSTRLINATKRSLHIYGLHRKAALASWYWADDVAFDKPLLSFEAMQGSFVHNGETSFYCYRPADRSLKTPEQRSRDNSYQELGGFHRLRCCWSMAEAACFGERLAGRSRLRVPSFLCLYLLHDLGPRAKKTIYNRLPIPVRTLWRALK